jgi:hypothetical protein
VLARPAPRDLDPFDGDRRGEAERGEHRARDLAGRVGAQQQQGEPRQHGGPGGDLAPGGCARVLLLGIDQGLVDAGLIDLVGGRRLDGRSELHGHGVLPSPTCMLADQPWRTASTALRWAENPWGAPRDPGAGPRN